MQFIRERMTGHFEDKADGRLFDEMGDSFKPVIYGATQEFFDMLPGMQNERRIQGDFFITSHRDLFYYIFSPGFDALTAGAVCNSVRARIDWHKFREALTKSVGGGEWNNAASVSEQFQALLEETSPLNVSDWERKAAVALQRNNLRSMLKIVASRPSISLQEAAGDRGLFEVSEDVQLLENLGMITRDFEIYCVDTNQKISCVSTLSALDDAAKRGFKCFHCGRSISAERIVQSLSITESGLRLSAKNMWLAYLVGAALCDAGVDPNKIVVKSENNGDIVEVFADVKGSLMMFAVSEDELTSDVAFRFITRSRFFNPEWGYLVTPVDVNADVRKVITSVSDRLDVIEGLDALSGVVREGAAKASDKVLQDLLASFNNYTKLDIGGLISDYMLNKAFSAAPAAADAPDFIPIIAVEAADEPEAAEELNSDASAVQESLAGGHDAESDRADEMNSAEDGSDSAAADESSPSEDISAAGEIYGEGNSEIDLKSDAVPEEHNFQSIIENVLRLMPAACESNDTDEVNALISSVAEMDDCSIMVATPDGLPFLGDLNTVYDSDLVAALQLDLMQNVANALADNNLGSLKNVILCSADNTMRVYFSADDLTVITHQKAAEIDGIAVKHSKSTPNLKRALKGLRSLPGVSKCMVLTVDGELVQSIGFNPDEENESSIAECFSYMMRDVINGFCADVDLGEVRACAMRTDKAVYHVMRLGSDHYLVSELGSKVPDYVWRRDVPAEASFVLANV